MLTRLSRCLTEAQQASRPSVHTPRCIIRNQSMVATHTASQAGSAPSLSQLTGLEAVESAHTLLAVEELDKYKSAKTDAFNYDGAELEEPTEPTCSPRLQVLQQRVRRRQAQLAWLSAKGSSIRQRPRSSSLTRLLRVRSDAAYLARPYKVALGSWEHDLALQTKSSQSPDARQKLDQIDFQWAVSIMTLQAGQRVLMQRPLFLQRFVDKYASFRASRKRLHLLWAHLPVRSRMKQWKDAILWCIQHRPRRALRILSIALEGRSIRPPRYMLLDCLTMLSRHFLWKQANIDVWASEALWHLIIKTAHSDSRGPSTDSQESVQLLLASCDDRRVKTLYDALSPIETTTSGNTMLHFLHRFSDIGSLDLCTNLLEKISRDPLTPHLRNQQVEKACVKLLRTAWGHGDPYPIQSAILSWILELGIRLNTRMYNVVLLSMIEGRDFDTAWKTFNLAKQSDHFEIDRYTYAILAKGAKLSGNRTIFDMVLHGIRANPRLLDDVLMTEVLGATCVFNSGSEFTAMLDLYTQHYDLRPLIDLGLIGSGEQVQRNIGLDKKSPNKYILGQMMLVCNVSEVSSERLIRRYQIFQEFVRKEHPLIAPLARDTYVPNSFLMALTHGRSARNLPFGTVILKHMLSPPPSPNSTPYAKPDVITWSILMHAYLSHGQKSAAEKVLAMIYERGLKPDRVTWNTLISGYCEKQDIAGAVGALKRMEEAGEQSDSWTFKGLGKVHNRDKLLKMLKLQMEQPPEENILAEDTVGEVSYQERIEGTTDGSASQPVDMVL